MAALAALALLMGTVRFAVVHLPHTRECLRLAGIEERAGSNCRRAAVRYRSCLRAVPCAPSGYCGNACLRHEDSTRPADRERAEAAAAHRRAADDHERAADRHARLGLRYRRAAFRWSEPIPGVPPGPDDELVRRYQCDTF